MNNERLIDLLAYLNGLTKLANSEVGYTCTREIGECIDWIREEFAKDAVEKSLTDEPTDALKYELMSRGYIVTARIPEVADVDAI